MHYNWYYIIFFSVVIVINVIIIIILILIIICIIVIICMISIFILLSILLLYYNTITKQYNYITSIVHNHKTSIIISIFFNTRDTARAPFLGVFERVATT
jgi:hypothetical protein